MQKDFYIIVINCEPRLNIIDIDNLCKRKIYLISIFVILSIEISLSSIIYGI